jgi:hypothetical protein
VILKTVNSARGAFATVVIDSAENRAYKIFKNNRHPDYFGEDSFEDRRNSLVFESQVAAYNIIKANPILQSHTPNYFGVPFIERVLDHEGADISYQYLLECCYCIQLCVGEERKFGICRLPHLESFAKLMSQHRIEFMFDSSVFNPDSERGFLFIDFATHDAATQFEMQCA